MFIISTSFLRFTAHAKKRTSCVCTGLSTVFTTSTASAAVSQCQLVCVNSAVCICEAIFQLHSKWNSISTWMHFIFHRSTRSSEERQGQPTCAKPICGRCHHSDKRFAVCLVLRVRKQTDLWPCHCQQSH